MELHTYKIKLHFGGYNRHIILTSERLYPDEFLRSFCEDIIEGIESNHKNSWLSFLGIEKLSRVPVERNYEIEYLGNIKHYRLDYNIINISEAKSSIALIETPILENGKTK